MTTSVRLVPREVVRRSAQIGLPTIAAGLRAVLGLQMTAHIASQDDPAVVARWADGDMTAGVTPDIMRRLRAAWAMCIVLADVGEAPETIQVWMMGMNQDLDDQAPLEVLRDGDPDAARDAGIAWAGGA